MTADAQRGPVCGPEPFSAGGDGASRYAVVRNAPSP